MESLRSVSSGFARSSPRAREPPLVWIVQAKVFPKMCKLLQVSWPKTGDISIFIFIIISISIFIFLYVYICIYICKYRYVSILYIYVNIDICIYMYI